jgi:predicted negative regulator of RcsB-dependent stress response
MTRILLTSLCLLSVSWSATAAENISDHEAFCAAAPNQPCETYIQQQLAKARPYSAVWYKTTSYYLDYLFDQHQFAALKNLIEPLLQRESLPEVFALQLYFYYAKALNALQQKDQAKIYADKAMPKLEQIYQVFGEPFRMLELANLQLQFGESEKAEQILWYTEQHFIKSKDPVFVFELNSNKAILAHAKDDLIQAAQLRQLALDAALQTGQKGKIIVAYGNLARTKQLLGQLESARDTYLASLPLMVTVDDQLQRSIHQLRLAEICWQLKQYEQAQNYLAQVNTKLLGQPHQVLYQKLSTLPELLEYSRPKN